MFIDELLIVEACRGPGLGTRAFAFAEYICRDLGARALHLAVAFGNERARAVYEKHGFSPTGCAMMTLAIADCPDFGCVRGGSEADSRQPCGAS